MLIVFYRSIVSVQHHFSNRIISLNLLQFTPGLYVFTDNIYIRNMKYKFTKTLRFIDLSLLIFVIYQINTFCKGYRQNFNRIPHIDLEKFIKFTKYLLLNEIAFGWQKDTVSWENWSIQFLKRNRSHKDNLKRAPKKTVSYVLRVSSVEIF